MPSATSHGSATLASTDATARAALLADAKSHPHIIPEDGRDSPVGQSDDDEYDGSGIGEADDGPVGMDEEEDEDFDEEGDASGLTQDQMARALGVGPVPLAGTTGNGGGSGGGGAQGRVVAKKTKRTAKPDWLMMPFRKVLEDCKKRNPQGLFALYHSLNTFWVPKKSTYFILQQNNLTPEKVFDPSLFVWDPEPLNGSIPCPNCSCKLNRHGSIDEPRRVVGLKGCFWIVGFRYICPRCSRAKPEGQNVVFRSWDRRIIARCRPELAAEFPARLSHRNAIENGLFELMRSCFQNGMGSKQFADILRVQHLLEYDNQHLQYLEHIYARQLDKWTGKKYDAFPSFDDRGPKGRHGFVPGGEWLRDMYDQFVEEHGVEMDKFTALLSAKVCALDHSHKVRSSACQHGTLDSN